MYRIERTEDPVQDRAVSGESPSGNPKTEQDPPIRLNLGSGARPLPGFKNLDRKSGEDVYPLDCVDNSVDEIYASHILEHFGHGEVKSVLENWYAKLKPGGIMKIAVPDMEWIVEQYQNKTRYPLLSYLMGGQVDENDYHKCAFDADSLKQLMAGVGLERIGRWESDIDDCASLEVSLNLQGYKPVGLQHRAIKTCAVLSCPRFGPTMHFQSAVSSFARLQIPYYPMQGAFWHQVLSEVIERAMPDNEYIITCDYDSVFTHQDVAELLRLMVTYPEADAIMPLQYRRHDAGFLGYRSNPVGELEFMKDIIPMDSGHFGLTILKSSALKSLKKPWFLGIPSEDGRWGDGKIDPDTYFWRSFQHQGLKLFLATKVRIGHLMEVVAFPDKDLNPGYIPLSEYDRYGVPAFANSDTEAFYGAKTDEET